jgi:hypothetical protein
MPHATGSPLFLSYGFFFNLSQVCNLFPRFFVYLTPLNTKSEFLFRGFRRAVGGNAPCEVTSLNVSDFASRANRAVM